MDIQELIGTLNNVADKSTDVMVKVGNAFTGISHINIGNAGILVHLTDDEADTAEPKEAEEPSLWGFKVRDRVRYADSTGMADLGERVVLSLYPEGGNPGGGWDSAVRIELGDPTIPRFSGRAGAAYNANEITKVEDN